MFQILVLQRGWIYVGYVQQEGDDFVLSPAACIHRWGTSHGLPELQDGPNSETVLHHCSYPVRAHYLTIVHRLDCNASTWREALDKPVLSGKT